MVFEMNGRGLIAVALAFVLPLVVGLVTKQSWHPGAKAVLLLFLTALSQFLVAWQDTADGESFQWQPTVWSIALAFVMSIAVHFGLWKPTGASDAAQDSLIRDQASTPLRR